MFGSFDEPRARGSVRRAPVRRERRVWLASMVLIGSAWLLACETEADRAEAVVRELAAALPRQPGEGASERRARLVGRFEARVAPQVRLEVFALEHAEYSRPQLVAHAVELSKFPLSALELEGVQVDLDASEKRARVAGSARASASQAADVHALVLGFEVGLARRGGNWQVTRLWLDDPKAPLPEARP